MIVLCIFEEQHFIVVIPLVYWDRDNPPPHHVMIIHGSPATASCTSDSMSSKAYSLHHSQCHGVDEWLRLLPVQPKSNFRSCRAAATHGEIFLVLCWLHSTEYTCICSLHVLGATHLYQYHSLYSSLLCRMMVGFTMSHAQGQFQFLSVLSGVATSWMLKKINQLCRVYFDWSWFFCELLVHDKLIAFCLLLR